MLNWIPGWLKSRRELSARGTRKPSPSKPRKISIERLEDRSVPATLSITDVSLTEGNSGQKDFVFSVSLSEASAATVTVQYSTAEGTASDNSDFQRIPNGNQPNPTLTFLPGETVKTLSVRVKGDITSESDETFFVNLSNAVNATILDGQGTGTILNDDTAPVANPDAFSVNEDTALTVGAPGVLANDTDAQNEPLTAALVSGPANGSLTLNSDGSFTYTPAADFNGTDSFTYRANDGNLNSAPATVTITVNPVNDAPIFTVGTNQTTAEDAGTQTVPGWATGISAGPANEAGQALEFVVTTDNPSLFAAGPAVGADGTLTFTPAADANGQATVTVVLRDDGGTANGGQDTSPAQTFTITVTAVNDAPVAADLVITTAEDAAKTGQVTATDIDGDPLTFTLVSDPAHGTVEFNPDGTFVYTPEANYTGPDSFTFNASDGTAASNVATVSITVTAVNDAPVAADLAITTAEDAAKTGQVTATDVDGDALTFSLVSDPAHGTVAFNPDGTFVYTPDPNYNGPDSFTFNASDGTAASNVATVSITVTAVNDAPVAADLVITTAEDAAKTGQVTATDADGDALTFSLVSDPAHGTVEFNADGSFVYTPDANYTGPDSFTFNASDGTAASNVATVSITVTAVNDAPVLSGGAALAPVPEASTDPAGETIASLFAGLVSDSDAGDTLAGIAVVGNPQNADQGAWQYSTNGGATWFDIGAVGDVNALVLSAGTRIRFLPALGFSGIPDPLVVRAIDTSYAGSFTDGATRITADATTAGGTTPFSAATATIDNLVTDVSGVWLSNGNLFISGTSGDDRIIVRPATGGRVAVVLNGQVIGTFARADVTGRIRVRGMAGNDRVRILVPAAIPADLYGGPGDDILWGGKTDDRLFGEAGNDRLHGGKGNDIAIGDDGDDRIFGGVGNDILLGGAGADRLFGSVGNDVLTGGDGDDRLFDSPGHDVLIGGNGADIVQAGTGSDLLIAGATNFDLDLAALDNIAAEWTSASNYSTRIAHLAGLAGGLNGTTFLTSTTVHDDAVEDILRGGSGLDWFWTGDLDRFVLSTDEVSATS
jgi:VCBS repeat-containing protein